MMAHPPSAFYQTKGEVYVVKSIPDFDLMEAAYDFTVSHQSEWDQRNWAKPIFDHVGNVCGTACCYAGNVLIVLGYRLVWSVDQSKYSLLRIYNPEGNLTRWDEYDIQVLAQKALRLSPNKAARLFMAGNSLVDIRATIDAIKEGSENG